MQPSGFAKRSPELAAPVCTKFHHGKIFLLSQTQAIFLKKWFG